MSHSEEPGNYWLRKRAVASSTPAPKKSPIKTRKSKTMLSKAPIATDEEFAISVPSEDSGESSDESDCEKSSHQEEVTTFFAEPPAAVETGDDKPDENDESPKEETEKEEPAAEQTECDADGMTPCFSHSAAEQAERFVRKVKEAAWRWRVTDHNLLPDWLKDNDFLHFGHRPQIKSFKSCFGSIFRIHTETGNIWTHLIGFIAFVILMIYFLVYSIIDQEKWDKIIVYMAFFIGAVMCMFFSWVFHTVYCHSSQASHIFSRLDYSGISLLIIGSFIPWLYFGFYCNNVARYIYMSLIVSLGVVCIVVSFHNKFSQRKYRALRAGLFLALGLCGVIPGFHFLAISGIVEAFQNCAFGWLLLMGALYVCGAIMYAVRIPERFFPGKCDIWFHSHQFFHILVLVAAFVHYHGINQIATYRETLGVCVSDILEDDV